MCRHSFLVYILLLLSVLFGPSLGNYKIVKLSCQDKKLFVDGHNMRRLSLAKGKVYGQPAASNMLEVVWDEELAQKAENWAKNGIFAHNPNRLVASKRWPITGENLYYSQTYITNQPHIPPNIDEALEGWWEEHKDYKYEPFHLGTKEMIGHYTQMAWANTTHIGCAISMLRQMFTEILYVCNYAPPGNYLGFVPYIRNVKKVNPSLKCLYQCDKIYGTACKK